MRLEVDGTPCVAYPRLTGPVALGDEVIVNTQARELGLGSGGFDMLYANLTRGLDLAAEPGAHVMKLPYTPLQSAAAHAEEERRAGGDARRHAGRLLLAPQPARARLRRPRRVRVWRTSSSPGGALPVSLSDTVRELKRRGLLETAVAAAPCVDGDVQCVSVPAALAWAAAHGFDVVVCAIGPGIVGTGTKLGHGGLAAARCREHRECALGVADPRRPGVGRRHA